MKSPSRNEQDGAVLSADRQFRVPATGPNNSNNTELTPKIGQDPNASAEIEVNLEPLNYSSLKLGIIASWAKGEKLFPFW